MWALPQALGVATSLHNPSAPHVSPAGAFYLGAALYLLLSNQLHYRVIQFSGSEWILSTPFDASLLTPEPPHGGSFFFASGLHKFLRGGVANSRAPRRRAAFGGVASATPAPRRRRGRPLQPSLQAMARISFKRKLQIGRRCA
jgi:hypothetical protein